MWECTTQAWIQKQNCLGQRGALQVWRPQPTRSAHRLSKLKTLKFYANLFGVKGEKDILDEPVFKMYGSMHCEEGNKWV